MLKGWLLFSSLMVTVAAVAVDVQAMNVALTAVPVELPQFTALMKKAAPSVVNVSSVPSQTLESMCDPERLGHAKSLRHFCSLALLSVGNTGIRRASEGQSLGSGIVVASDGYILTSAHAVDMPGRIKVRFNDRREMDAHLVGADRYTDLALLKVEAHDLLALPMGDSDQLQQGEWVAALGAPSGFDQTISAGIVSAVHRTSPDGEGAPLIQTDAAITPGNAGGPLLNLKGDVVGINIMRQPLACSTTKLSFATPSHDAAQVVEQLKREGRVQRAWLGIALQPIDGRLARAFGRDLTQGALVASVAADSPAGRAGLHPGDIILAMDRQRVAGVQSVMQLMAAMAPGQSVLLDLWRHRQRIEASVTLDASSVPVPSRQQLPGASHVANERLGAVVSALDDQAPFVIGTVGVKIEAVDSNGSAAKAGLMAGDTLLALDDQAISSPAQLADTVDRLPNRQVIPVRVARDGHAMYVAIALRGR